MFKITLSRSFCAAFIFVLIEFVLSAPQGYNYYSNQQRINAQRAQAQRQQAQRIRAQNSYQQSYRTTRSPYNSYRNTVSRADAENAKFLGSRNQESDERQRTLNIIRRKKQQAFGNPCYFRSANQDRAEGRFLWDLNVHNYFPSSNVGPSCGGNYGSRPFNGGFFQNFLSLFLPGGALGQNIPPYRPYQSPIQSSIQSDSGGSGGLPAGVQNDLSIDPSLDGTGSGSSSGSNFGSTNNFGSSNNYGSTNNYMPGGAPSLTPGQLVSGFASTVNGVIQQLAGNQPAYG